ncbi:MAG TPA: aminoglycoside phosphotransferase, partial [Micromonosporaceae bacterium]|nr:aminoglycoside phosphotransferase [Micromonosporaceae bacterium]
MRVTRLAGGSKKGVYRLALDDASAATLIAYVWHADENFWPAAPDTDPDDPFRHSSGIALFESAHRRLASIGVRTPEVIALDRSRTHLAADVAFVEDLGGGTLEALIARDRAAADGPLSMLRDALTAMHGATAPSFGTVAAVESGAGVRSRPAAEVVLARAEAHLAEAAGYEPRVEAH